MADSIGDAFAAVVARDKSRSWAFGRLHRAFPTWNEALIRSALEELRVEHRGRAREEIIAGRQDYFRPAASWLEPLSAEVWRGRAEQLCEVVDGPPLDVVELLACAQQQLGWSRNRTLQALAAAETAGLVSWTRAGWQREPLEDHGAAGVGPRLESFEAGLVTANEASRVRISAAPPIPWTNPIPKRHEDESHMTTASTTTEKSPHANGTSNSGSSSPASASSASAPSGSAAAGAPKAKPGNAGKPKAKSKAKPAAPAPTPTAAESHFETAIAPLVDRLVRRALAGLLKEALRC